MVIKTKTWRFLIAVAVLLLAVLAVFSIWLYRELHAPVAHAKPRADLCLCRKRDFWGRTVEGVDS